MRNHENQLYAYLPAVRMVDPAAYPQIKLIQPATHVDIIKQLITACDITIAEVQKLREDYEKASLLLSLGLNWDQAVGAGKV